jgi:hypothetical protein
VTNGSGDDELFDAVKKSDNNLTKVICVLSRIGVVSLFQKGPRRYSLWNFGSGQIYVVICLLTNITYKFALL